VKRDVRAVVAASTGRRGYREWPTQQVESFMIDSAMDTDSDAFSVDIGDPDNMFRPCLNRDTEVRAALYTGPTDQQARTQVLTWGIADDVEVGTDDKVVSIAGRDFTALAVDSMHPPGQWSSVRPHVFVKREADKLHIPHLRLAQVSRIPKFYTDGSETYWEVWYRMYRKKKMWIWAEPNGILLADGLNYDSKPRYAFGTAKVARGQGDFLQIERCVLHSSKQRAGEVWVFGEKDTGKNTDPIGFIGKAIDPSIRSWRRRPLKIVQSGKAKSAGDARREAWEELFEGKVGAVEITLTIPDPGYIIRQNEMAIVRIPEIDLYGRFFVVGTQISGGPDGYRQEVRLREKNFAISRRVPDDPELEKDPGEQKIPGTVGASLLDQGIRWGDAFAAAAHEFHDGWDMTTFLAVLLSICAHESSFRNVRGGGTIEWYAKPHPAAGSPEDTRSYQTDLHRWRSLFANKQTNPLNPRYPSSECAVGPMQLVTPGYKVWADQYGGRNDEYEGGRWEPNANIRAGARAFLRKLSGLDPHKGSLIWEGVKAYYGSGSESANTAYMKAVKKLYESKYKKFAETAIETGKTLPAGESTKLSIPGGPEIQIPDAAPHSVKKAVNFCLRQLGKSYVWGAVGPEHFDCSGLVYAAYKFAFAAGTTVHWYRGTTYTYFGDKHFAKIAKDELLAGDMVFFRGRPPEHMGLYLGDGYMIQAPKTGDVVKVSQIRSGYYRDAYVGARRVVAWGMGPGGGRGD
jgi:cell wall-associated NlpC family hydrolase/prophage tail gpP-like protein